MGRQANRQIENALASEWKSEAIEKQTDGQTIRQIQRQKYKPAASERELGAIENGASR